MTMIIAGHEFKGPYTSTKRLEDKQGVYAVHCLIDGEPELLDVGESARVKSRVESHERMKCWQRKCSGIFTVSVFYTPHWTQMSRMKLSKKIRDEYNPPCGKKIDGKFRFIIDQDS